MIYAQIKHYSNPSFPEKMEIYLEFNGGDALLEKSADSEVQQMTNEWEVELDNFRFSLEESKSEMFSEHFNKNRLLISRFLPLSFLAKNNFIPVSKNFFYKI